MATVDEAAGVSITAVMTLGLAIGANTAVFSLVSAILWQPLRTPLRATTEGQGGGMKYHILLRLRPDVTWPAADAEMAAIADPALRVRRLYPAMLLRE